jgi:hypothetical protein
MKPQSGDRPYSRRYRAANALFLGSKRFFSWSRLELDLLFSWGVDLALLFSWEIELALLFSWVEVEALLFSWVEVEALLFLCA